MKLDTSYIQVRRCIECRRYQSPRRRHRHVTAASHHRWLRGRRERRHECEVPLPSATHRHLQRRRRRTQRLIQRYESIRYVAQLSFVDRIGLSLSTDDYPLLVQERMEAADRVNQFWDGSLHLTDIYREEEALRDQVVKARQRLQNIKISHEQLLYLCNEASKGLCEGQRAEITAARVAVAVSALRGVSDYVSPDDLRIAVRLAISPRSRCIEVREQDREEAPPQFMPAQSPEMEAASDETRNSDEENEVYDKIIRRLLQNRTYLSNRKWSKVIKNQRTRSLHRLPPHSW